MENPEHKREYDIPSVEPGLQEIPVEPEKDKYKKPTIPIEEVENLIKSIEEEEKEDEEHKKKTEDIIKQIHQP